MPWNKAATSSKHYLDSTPRVILLCFIVSFAVFACSLLLQWFIYDDWLHHTGPVRLVGSGVAALLTFVGILRWQHGIREREQEMLRRFETIASMNDQIRNALQVIECTTYIADPDAASHVRQAVARIDDALRGVIAEVPQPADLRKGSAAATNGSTPARSA